MAEAAPDGTPPLWALRHLDRAEGHEGPTHAGDVTVLDWRMTRGDPLHGALRSDDHLSHYEADVPLTGETERHNGDGVDLSDGCPRCGHDRGVFVNHAHHHIAGYWSLTCRFCDTEIAGEKWS